MGRNVWNTTSADVSRHGMFLLADDPPRERFLVKLAVELPDGPLEATAFVSRRVEGPERTGIGVQFFALSAQAKGRWDAFVSARSGEAVEPSATQPLPADSSTFLIKLRSVDRLIDFFERNVRSGQVQMTTPVVQEVGASVALVVIHPESEREFLFRARVTRVSRDAPKSMDLKLEPVTEKMVSRFYGFVTTGTTTETMDLLVNPSVSPPPGRADEPHVKDDESLPYAFEVDTNTGDLSIDIEVDAEDFDELETIGFEAPDPVPDGPRAPLEVVAVRCTACGAFLGTAAVDSIPEPLSWVLTRRIRYDRFEVQLLDRLEPVDEDALERAQVEHGRESITGEALVALARIWRQQGAVPREGPDLGPSIRRAAASLMSGRDRARVDAPCPACGELSVFVAPE